MRTVIVIPLALAVVGAACASTPSSGPVGDPSSLSPRILNADTARPPRSATIQLDRQSYVALLLVVPGHSASLLYPRDSATNNRMSAGAHQISFQVPTALVLSDTAIANRGRPRATRADSARAPRQRTVVTTPVDPTLGTFLLLLTSEQRLDYAEIVERTSGVTLPAVQSEALNAIAKAVKGTLPTEPRDLGGYFLRVDLSR